MSNILKRNLYKASTSIGLRSQSRRCFSVTSQWRNEEQQDQFTQKKVEDIIADFEKPLIDPQHIATDDPRTILVASFEKFRPPPHRMVLTTQAMDKLRLQLFNAFNVSQLTTFLTTHNIQKGKLKKNQLITAVVERIWGLKTVEQVKEEERKRLLDNVKQSFPASRQELFFIIGDNGNTMRRIEQENDVKVTIDVSSNQYIVEGPSAAVIKTKRDIKTRLNIKEDKMDVPVEIVGELKTEVLNALADVSKVAGTFITLEEDNNKVCLYIYIYVHIMWLLIGNI
jgi:hypothetical protein